MPAKHSSSARLSHSSSARSTAGGAMSSPKASGWPSGGKLNWTWLALDAVVIFGLFVLLCPGLVFNIVSMTTGNTGRSTFNDALAAGFVFATLLVLWFAFTTPSGSTPRYYTPA